jgi:hypothetical protein
MNGLPAQFANAIPAAGGLPFTEAFPIDGLPVNVFGPQPGAGTLKKDKSKQQPMLHLCTVIDNSAPAMKDVLTKRLAEKITVDDRNFFKVPMRIYEDIADKVSEKYAKAIQQTFSGNEQDGTNLRISVLIQAKNNYIKLFKGTEDLFNKTYDTYKDFEQAMKQQFDASVEVEREKVGNNNVSEGKVKFIGGQNKSGEEEGGDKQNETNTQATTKQADTAAPTKATNNGCPEAIVQEVHKKIDDLYGKGTFKKKLLKIISHKLENAVNTAKKTDNINILLDAATDKVTDAFKEQLDKFMSKAQSNEQFFNLCIISAIGPEYIKQYFQSRDKNPNQTLGQYIDALVIKVTEGGSENVEQPVVDLGLNEVQPVQPVQPVAPIQSTISETSSNQSYTVPHKEQKTGIDKVLDGYRNQVQIENKPTITNNKQPTQDNNEESLGSIIRSTLGGSKKSLQYQPGEGGAKRKTKQRKNTRRKRRTRKLRK